MSLREKIPTGIYRLGLIGMITGSSMLTTGFYKNLLPSPEKPLIMVMAEELNTKTQSLISSDFISSDVPDLTARVNALLLEKSNLVASSEYTAAKSLHTRETQQKDLQNKKWVLIGWYGAMLLSASLVAIPLMGSKHRSYMWEGDARRSSEEGKLKLTSEECGEQQVPSWFGRIIFKNYGRKC